MNESYKGKGYYPAKETAKTVKCYYEGAEKSYVVDYAEYTRAMNEYAKRGGPVSFYTSSPNSMTYKLVFIDKNGYWKIAK